MTDLDDDLGTLDLRGDDAVITFHRRFRHPIEKVWRAVTEPEHLKAWFPGTVTVDEWRPGAPLTFTVETGESFDGEVVAVTPPTVLEIRWGPDRLRIELAPDGDGTAMTFTDTITEVGKAARDAAGWHERLVFLACELDGTAPPAERQIWNAVHPRYVERFGPEAATIGPPDGT